jgi:hypothetical protein
MANPRLNDQSDKKEEHTMTSSQPPLTPEQIAKMIAWDEGQLETSWSSAHPSCGYGCCGGGKEIDRDALTALVLDALRTAESQGEARGRRLALEQAAEQMNVSESESWTREEVRDWLLFRVQESQGSLGTAAGADAQSSAPVEAELRLCYVDGNWAYFTSRPLTEQWGDDWDDVPYEHNAEPPYAYADYDRAQGLQPWTVERVAWQGPFITPNHEHINSPYSVQAINRGAIAWLRPDYMATDAKPIPAGTTIGDFIRIVQAAGGKAYRSCDVATSGGLPEAVHPKQTERA